MKPFGLISQLANTRVTLPLTHIETRFRVTGEFAAVEMDQVFEQTARGPLDVTYTFPLPGDAAVYRCEMIVNNRLIRARVMEEQEARRTVAEKKAAGHRTALVETDRDNLFTLQLGNTAPGDRIVIRFAYLEKLDRLGSSLSLRIPLCPGIRYIPGQPLLRKNRGLGSMDDTDQVPDASRLSPPRIRADHPDAATVYLHGSLDADEVELRTLSSPSHPAIIRPAGNILEVELAGEDHVPDRDFILRWEETPPPAQAKPKAWCATHTDPATGLSHRHALLQLRAPQADNTTAASDDFAQDIYFLLDRSGSMDGPNWTQAAAALHAFVRQLGARDRVWLTCFESAFQDFSDSPMPRDELLADPAFQNLAALGTGGGTELLPALLHVLEKRARHSTRNPARLILITDGQVGNEDEILRLMRQPAQHGMPMHCFGIDRAVNDAFLKNLARITGGRCALMTPDDDIPAAVEELAHTLRRPVLTRLRLEPAHAETPNESGTLPDLCAGEVLLTAVCLPAEGTQPISLTATLPDGAPHTVSYDISAVLPDELNPIPRLLWAKERILHLLDTDRNDEAIQLAITHNLTCRGAAFVAWDGAEKVTVAKREVCQPSLDLSSGLGALFGPSVQSSRSHPMIPAGAALHDLPQEMHFFEAKVADYQRASFLRMCSDEDLVGEVRYSLAETPATPPFLPNLRATPDFYSGLPDTVSRLIAKHQPAYGSFDAPEDDTAVPLAAWVHRFARLLATRAALPEPVARLLALLLRGWALAILGTQRQRQLQTWLTDLETAADPAAAFSELLAAAEPDHLLKDAKKLLEVTVAHPVKKKGT